MIIALIGVFIAYRQLSAQEPLTFLRSTDADAPNINQWQITVKNFGSHLAKNVNIRTVVVTSFKWDELERES